MLILPESAVYNMHMTKLTKQRRSEYKDFTRGAKRYLKRWVKRCERQQGKKMCNAVDAQ